MSSVGRGSSGNVGGGNRILVVTHVEVAEEVVDVREVVVVWDSSSDDVVLPVVTHHGAPSINFNQFLEKEKLKGNGSNFTDWSRHVRIFLTGVSRHFVLEAPLGPPPPPAVSEDIKNVYETRVTRYSEIQCAILCSLEAELQKRFEHHDPCEMMRELKLIFETHAAVESYEASKQFFNCMMEEGSSVSEHMFAMSGHAKKLSDLGIVIPNKLGIHRVLQSLPPSYKNFVMNYNMQNMNKELPELFSMLKSAEVEIKKENQVLMVNKTTSFKKQGKPNKGNFKKGGKKGKGHWKRNCPKYLADLKSGHAKKKDMASPINFNQFLEKEKLKSNGSNFTDWFRHVRIFLNGGNLQYVLDAPLGDPPAETETDEVKSVYATRKTRYSQVQCAILCSLESDLQKRFEHHDPHELMKELKTIFETHAAVECYEASKHFFSCMMEEGSSISEHMLVMTGHAKKLSDLGIVIPNRLGINRVLQSLPPSYKNFVMNYNMQNMNKEFPELFGMLKAAEIEIKKEHQVLMVNKTTSFKKQGKSKGKFKKGGKKAATPPMKPKNGPKPDADCYYCKEKGHWKRNCSKYLADLKSGLVKKKKEGMEHWTAVKNILKYLKRTKDMFLCYGGDQELVVTSYTDASWNTDPDDSKSQSGYVFILNGAAVSWASSKCTVAKSSTESEYIAASEASSKRYG
ncbi:hypothetical protein QYE76_032926 [Lolium multiflorum]|uniref:CCHC-type domain-containing protein n=1 Tax=Lolium multiflorum TaxID=4521 RepID=A0AAD8QY58_LOLMU|nr:hypothetical protein QYE76_032926 [Lolium multiflorum]